MARYELSATKTTGAAAGIIGQLRAGSARDIRIFEVHVFATTAVAGLVSIGRTATVGATFTSTGPAVSLDPVASAGVAVLDTAATTAPTITSPWWRQVQLPATIGAGVIWRFDTGIVLPVSGSVIVWQLSTAAVGYAVTFIYDE